MPCQNSEYHIHDIYQVRRVAGRATYTKEVIFAIIDACYMCHISFIQNSETTTIPMACWREDDYIYFHAANKGRLHRQLPGRRVCISLALFDGLVLGHSPFNHSYNFRSVVIHGEVESIECEESKRRSMKAFMDHVLPGRWEQLRPVLPKELQAICLMRVKLDQAAGKIRDEYPDEETDTPEWPAWIGVIPAHVSFDMPVPDTSRNQVTTVPSDLINYTGIDKFRPDYASKKTL